VVDRRFRGGDESVHQLAQTMYDFCTLNRRQRIIMRNRTERLSELLDWKNLHVFYREARHKALERMYPDGVAKIVSESINRMPRPLSMPGTPSHSQKSSPHHSDGDTDETDSETERERAEWIK